LIELKLM